MDDNLTADQRMLADASARFAEQEYPMEAVRRRTYDTDGQFASSYQQGAGQLGWYSLLVPEELGGGSVSGNGVADAAVIAYQRGRLLQPGPFVGTNVVAHALAVAGSEEQRAKVLPALMAGESLAAWAVTPPPGQPAVNGAVLATPAGGGYRLSGRCTLVEDPGPGGWVLVTAASEQGPSQFLLPAETSGLACEPVESLDITRRYVELRLDGADVAGSALVGEAGQAAAAIEEQLAVASALLAAESVGAMDQDFAMVLQYAKDRIAFGRPIGSFQAVKHVLADTSLFLEMSKAIAKAAADRVGEHDGYGPQAASMAKAFVGDCGIDLAQNCLQIFGGIGFTWEHDQHLYLRRLTTDAAVFGDPAWHREWLCQLSGV